MLLGGHDPIVTTDLVEKEAWFLLQPHDCKIATVNTYDKITKVITTVTRYDTTHLQYSQWIYHGKMNSKKNHIYS